MKLQLKGRNRSIVAVVFHVCALIGATFELLQVTEKMGLFCSLPRDRKLILREEHTVSTLIAASGSCTPSFSMLSFHPLLTNQLLVYSHTFPHYFCNLFPLFPHPHRMK